jgi:serine/threonine-protein kinase
MVKFEVELERGAFLPEARPVREERDRILASAELRQSESLRRLLLYIVEAVLDGRQHQLKERTIGIEVFGRGDDFDPRLDAIVRVQARNLRSKLAAYYQADGRANGLRIELFKGSYVPSFVDPPAALAPAESPVPVADRVADPAAKPWSFPVTAPVRAVAAAVLLTAAIMVGAWRISLRPAEKASATPPPSIAVLPFTNLSGDPNNLYFSEGLSEELLDALTRVEGLKVAARSSSFRFGAPGEDVRKIGEALQVRTILEGSVRESAGHVRVTAQLIDASTGYHLWSETYDRPASDVLKLEDELARAIVTRLRVKMTNAGQPQLAIDPRAYDEYLKARFFIATPDPASFAQARVHALEALRIDPRYAAAMATLATTYSGSAAYGFTNPREDWVRGRDIAKKALEIDPTSTEALIAMASFQAWHEWDYPGAEYRYRRVLDLTPGDARYRQYYASFLAEIGQIGRREDARREMQRALELDPLSMQVRYGAAQLHYFWREYPQAAEIMESSIRTEPAYGQSYKILGLVYAQQGRYAEALKCFDEMNAKVRGRMVGQGERAYTLGLAGRQPEARAILTQLLEEAKRGYFPAARVADAYLGVDEPENALVWIDKAIEDRELRPGVLQVDPRYSRLLSLPQAQPLLRKTHLIP